MKSSVFVGYNHIFVISNQKIYACGCNSFNQLGMKDAENKNSFQLLPKQFQNQFKNICCDSAKHSLFLSKKGEVLGCGWSEFKALDEEKQAKTLGILPFFKNKTVEAIYCTKGGSFFQIEKKIYVCGDNYAGALGIEHKSNSINAMELNLSFMQENENIINIKGGDDHSLILSNMGNVYSAGEGSYGQLGRSLSINSPYSSTFKRIKFSEKQIKITQISAGDYHSLFLSSDGDVYGCGSNLKWQLGLFHTKNNFSPELIPIGKNERIIKIECGCAHSFFVTSSQKIFCCGDNSFDQLALKKKFCVQASKIPTEIKFNAWKTTLGYKFIDVFSSESTTYFLNDCGDLFSIGSNDYGQAGVGNFKTVIRIPTKIKGITIDTNKNNLKHQILNNLKHSMFSNVSIHFSN